MPKLVYRGVAHSTEDKARLDHHHGDGLRYRGESYDGYIAEKSAAPRPGLKTLVYRGVVADRDR